ncbi:MAG: sensor domain-containing diguanylate cyclase [Negativicutes bacterium]|nr:sensor domain-containing diguanylate cyclase [Negativicutes bacterium]
MKRFNLDNKSYQQILDELFEGMFFTDRNKRVIYWNKGAKEISGYTDVEVMEKQYCREFLRHVDRDGISLCENRCPIDVSLADRKACETEAFIQHKEGYRVPVSIRTVPVADKDGKIIGVVELFRDDSRREVMVKELEDAKEMATRDGLTGLRNRRHGEIVIESRLAEFKAGGLSFGLLFVDIDHFKVVNDTHGHDVGDQVLKMVAQTLVNNTRQTDVAVRWGGEELVVVLAGANMQDKTPKIAEKLRVLIGQSTLSLDANTSVKVTVSIGGTLARQEDTMDSLVRRADQLMYECKKAGRNCVRVLR